MPRPPDEDRRRDLALRAARVLEAEGLSISYERLAQALGEKRPTLAYHFPTVTDVIEAALVALLTEQSMHVLAAIGEKTHPVDKLFAQMKAIHAFHHGRESRVVFLTQAIAATGGARVPEIVQRGAAVFAAHRRAVVDRLREGIHAGTVAPCDPEALVATMRALTDGLMVQRVTDGIDLAGPHELVWTHLLAPLKRTPKKTSPKKQSPKKPRREKKP